MKIIKKTFTYKDNPALLVSCSIHLSFQIDEENCTIKYLGASTSGFTWFVSNKVDFVVTTSDPHNVECECPDGKTSTKQCIDVKVDKYITIGIWKFGYKTLMSTTSFTMCTDCCCKEEEDEENETQIETNPSSADEMSEENIDEESSDVEHLYDTKKQIRPKMKHLLLESIISWGVLALIVYGIVLFFI